MLRLPFSRMITATRPVLGPVKTDVAKTDVPKTDLAKTDVAKIGTVTSEEYLQLKDDFRFLIGEHFKTRNEFRDKVSKLEQELDLLRLENSFLLDLFTLGKENENRTSSGWDSYY